jgi:hypothetical protein
MNVRAGKTSPEISLKASARQAARALSTWVESPK